MNNLSALALAAGGNLIGYILANKHMKKHNDFLYKECIENIDAQNELAIKSKFYYKDNPRMLKKLDTIVFNNENIKKKMCKEFSK